MTSSKPYDTKVSSQNRIECIYVCYCVKYRLIATSSLQTVSIGVHEGHLEWIEEGTWAPEGDIYQLPAHKAVFGAKGAQARPIK